MKVASGIQKWVAMQAVKVKHADLFILNKKLKKNLSLMNIFKINKF